MQISNTLKKLTRKAAGFKSLPINCWESNQVTSKCPSFWTKLAKKTITIKFYILEILGNKFQLKLTTLHFWKKFAIIRIFSFKNRKSEHHHRILHIWVRLSTKFQLKLIISIFLTKVAQKGYLQSKTDAMNTTIELFIF